MGALVRLLGHRNTWYLSQRRLDLTGAKKQIATEWSLSKLLGLLLNRLRELGPGELSVFAPGLSLIPKPHNVGAKGRLGAGSYSWWL